MIKNKFFELNDEMIFVDLFLYLKKQNTLIISDLHIGYEESLNSKGILIPKTNYNELVLRIEKAINFIIKHYKLESISRIILNGDLLHDFSKISFRVKSKLQELIELLSNYSTVLIIEGNHDKVLKFILKDNIVHKKIILGDIMITHGDKILDEVSIKNLGSEKIKTIIIGHEHPAVSISSNYRSELYRCFLYGKFDSKNLIVTPSCNLSNEGSDVLSEKLLSPYLKNNSKLLDFNAYLISEEILDFGTLERIKKKFYKSNK